jgi:adenine-specific DNA-methyltransferase
MAKKQPTTKTVEALTHEEAKRKNIPTVEYQSVLQKAEQDPVRVAYKRSAVGLNEEKARRNRDLDPQLIWRGKDEQDWSDLVVQAPPLYIQEKVHPKALIDDLLRESREREYETGQLTPDLFADFNGIPKGVDKTEFYQHDQNWSNRMILGDSLQVMASLAEREGLRGKVQCIYFDPPYGIKFNSNFQWSTTSRDVKDGNAEHITREPEQVKAFRDTWRDGIHSYLTYLRDRLTVARDLLSDSGSLFVQIGDENVHLVRSLMEEVLGQSNFVGEIVLKTTSGAGSPTGGTITLAGVHDYVLWFAKRRESLKYRQLYFDKSDMQTAELYRRVVLLTGEDRGATEQELAGTTALPDGASLFRPDNLTSQSSPESATFKVPFRGLEIGPGKGGWKTNPLGMTRLQAAGRLYLTRNGSLQYLRKWADFNAAPINDVWTDVGTGSFTTEKLYVVQTNAKVITRCLLMSTDPGDLVLDPTCGSGTTATVAEQWGRRWITIDTSRVALALARARIMGARYSYYLLADSREGQIKEAEVTRTTPSSQPVRGNIRHGFVYERVPHIMLSSIANNAEIDVIWDKWQATLEPLRESLNSALKKTWQEWEIPREADTKWPDVGKKLHSDWWQARIVRQKEIDASIAAKAEFEYLYDKPYPDNKKARVAGPFTVESLSPHRVLGVDENDELIDTLKESSPEYGAKQSFAQMILENLKTSGVQQAHREGRITFTALTPWPGDLVCAEGRYIEGGSEPSPSGRGQGEGGVEKRAAIFIGPEFGTVTRPDLVAAAREAGDADFDVLIACAFNYDAHSTEFSKLGRIPVLKARMNADLHMADDLKNTGKGNLFVIFGEPDITVTSGQWLVARNGRLIATYEHVKELSGLGSLEEINRAGRAGLSDIGKLSGGGTVRTNVPSSAGRGVSGGEYRGGSGTGRDAGVPPVPGDRERVTGGDGNISAFGGKAWADVPARYQSDSGTGGHRWSNAQRTQTLAALENLRESDFPLSLTTDHKAQVTVHGVDVFKPQTGEVISDGAEGIACWFIDTDYNEESFFVRHAYFLGANDPYSALKTTLKAEINEEAWATLNSDTSRAFKKPKSGRIAVKVINHLGDEVMKVFKV